MPTLVHMTKSQKMYIAKGGDHCYKTCAMWNAKHHYMYEKITIQCLIEITDFDIHMTDILMLKGGKISRNPYGDSCFGFPVFRQSVRKTLTNGQLSLRILDQTFQLVPQKKMWIIRPKFRSTKLLGLCSEDINIELDWLPSICNIRFEWIPQRSILKLCL